MNNNNNNNNNNNDINNNNNNNNDDSSTRKSLVIGIDYPTNKRGSLPSRQLLTKLKGYILFFFSFSKNCKVLFFFTKFNLIGYYPERILFQLSKILTVMELLLLGIISNQSLAMVRSTETAHQRPQTNQMDGRGSGSPLGEENSKFVSL